MLSYDLIKFNQLKTVQSKKVWSDPEVKKFNKLDLVKGGPSPNSSEESASCYKTGS